MENSISRAMVPNRVAVYRIMRQYFISEVPMYSNLQGAQQQMVALGNTKS